MVNKQDLVKNYSKLTTTELMAILDHSHEYTPLAVSVAAAELNTRNISQADIDLHAKKKFSHFQDEAEKNLTDDLTIAQKFMFYNFWLPFTFAVKNNYSRDGYTLKAKQAKYYQTMGYTGIFAAVAISLCFEMGSILLFLLFALFFIPVVLHDLTVRREKRMQEYEDRLKDTDSSKKPKINTLK